MSANGLKSFYKLLKTGLVVGPRTYNFVVMSLVGVTEHDDAIINPIHPIVPV